MRPTKEEIDSGAWDAMAWTEPKYSREQVDEAGEVLISTDPHDLTAIREWDESREIATNWRSAHSYPLNGVQVTLRERSNRVDGNAVVGQRLKRLRSIKAKLRRLTRLSLSDLQDVGGCRSVVHSMDKLRQLDALYGESELASKLERRVDYIENPKERDGYRSIHYVLSYVPTIASREPYRGLKIEIQMRTRLQHMWATATETVSAFTPGHNLKAGIGDPEWFEFFKLVSNAFAVYEDCPLVPGMPTNFDEVVSRASELEAELEVRDKLSAWQASVDQLPTDIPSANWYLLALDVEHLRVQATAFPTESEASDVLRRLERKHDDNGDFDVVMVSSDSISNLRTIFPNYLVDMTAFVSALDSLIESGAQGRS